MSLFDREFVIKIRDSISETEISIIKAYDMLDRYCDNMTRLNFALPRLYTKEIISSLRNFNMGSNLMGYCLDQNLLNKLLPFYGNNNDSVYTLFINQSYNNITNNTYGGTLTPKLLYPRNYTFNNKENKQFIFNPFMFNIMVDRHFIIISVCFIIVLILFIFSIVLLYANKHLLSQKNVITCAGILWNNIMHHYCLKCCRKKGTTDGDEEGGGGGGEDTVSDSD